MARGRFHYKEGWYFSRLEDGSVLIERESEQKTWKGGRMAPLITARMVIDPDGWASVVASVSAPGDNAETFKSASELHAGICFLKGGPKA